VNPEERRAAGGEKKSTWAEAEQQGQKGAPGLASECARSTAAYTSFAASRRATASLSGMLEEGWRKPK
jgi:hypothetical protein